MASPTTPSKATSRKRPVILEPPDGGSVCRFFVLEPENKTLSAAQLEEASAAGFKAIGGEHCRPDTTRGPGMHTTRTIDYIVLLEGEVTLDPRPGRGRA